MSLKPYLVVSTPSAGLSNVHKVKNVPLQVRNEEHMHKIRIYQAFPFRFCILQAIKNWTVGRPRLRVTHCVECSSANTRTCKMGNAILCKKVPDPIPTYLHLHAIGVKKLSVVVN